MVFANARLVTALQKGSIVSVKDLKKTTATTSNTVDYPFWDCDEQLMCKELHYFFNRGYGGFLLGNGLPVLGNCDIALNMHQFIRNWTQFNIGEVIVSHERTRCRPLSDLSRAYKKAAGFKDLYEFDFNNSNDNKISNEMGYEWIADEADAAVFVMHYIIKK